MPIIPAIGAGLAALGGGSALAGATIAGGALAAGSSLLAAGAQKDAINGASDANAAASAAGLAQQQQQYDQTRADYAPWRQVGAGALQQLARTFNISVPANTFTVNGGVNSPAGGAAAPAGVPNAAPVTPGVTPAQTVVTPGQSASDAYFAANPDVAAEWQRIVSTGNAGNDKFRNDPANYAQWHYQTYGQNEGRTAPAEVAPVYAASPVVAAGGATTPTPASGSMPVTDTAGTRLDPNGLPTGATQSRYGDFFASPDFQFRLDEGNRAITGNAAAKGLLDSGALGKGLINYGQKAASQEFGSWFSRLSTLAGYGQSATAGTAAAGQEAANRSSGIIQNQGENLASSITAKGGINSGLINSAGSIASGLIQNVGAGSGSVTPYTPATSNAGWPVGTPPFNPQGLISTNQALPAGLFS